MDQQQPTSPGPRGSRTLSFRSDKSGGSKGRAEVNESPKDKEMRDRIWKSNSKANPITAMTEAQPGDIALLEQSTLSPLRELQHRDVFGNPIVDPDLSNPTRPRLERPLDTIRSFEKAIDNGYKRRSTYNRSDSNHSENQQYASRRNSYFGDHQNTGGSSRPSHHGSGYYGAPNGPPRNRNHPGRMQSDSNVAYQNRPYGYHGYHQSQQTMNTEMTNGSDSTGPWASHTEPSSENSSIDKITPAPKAYPHDGYASNGYSPNNNGFRGPIREEPSYGMYNGGGAPPVQDPALQRRPIALGNSNGNMGPPPPGKLPQSTARPETKKKEGWLKRRFSKHA